MEFPTESESERLWGFVPIGFSFRPSDFVLIRDYLYKKIANKPIPCSEMIRDCNLYGSLEPWEIWNTFGGPLLELEHHHHDDHEDLFFFTHLKKINSKGSRICRKVGSGTWQGEDSAKPILHHHSYRKIIGWKKRFRYEKKADSGDDHQHGCWIMYEYSLDSSLLRPDQPNDYVICRLRKNHLGFKRINNKKKLLLESETYTDMASTSNSQAVRKSNSKERKLSEMASTSNSEAYIANSNSQRVEDAAGTSYQQLLVGYDDDDWVLQQLWSELQQPPSLDALFKLM